MPNRYIQNLFANGFWGQLQPVFPDRQGLKHPAAKYSVPQPQTNLDRFHPRGIHPFRHLHPTVVVTLARQMAR